ncbi:MAG: hypothetical protein AAFQ74_18890 [Cyanobacteria bacterium J06623_4]
MRQSNPWLMMVVLFVIHLLMGLLLSAPQPPYWVWIAALVAVPMMVFGFNRPIRVSGKFDPGGLMAYAGGLLMVVALAIAANYIGSEQSFESVRFFTAIFGLAALTLMVVFLTAGAAIVSAQVGAQLTSKNGYQKSMMIVLSLCFLGLCFGGLGGLAIISLTAP